MSNLLKWGGGFVFLVGGLMAASVYFAPAQKDSRNAKNIFVGTSSDISYTRVVLQRLSKEISEDRDTQIFRLQWTVTRGGKSAYPEMIYNRHEKELELKPYRYLNVTDDAINQIAVKGGAVVDIVEYGATQTTEIPN